MVLLETGSTTEYKAFGYLVLLISEITILQALDQITIPVEATCSARIVLDRVSL